MSITILSSNYFSVIYSNAILEKPIVTCEPERIHIQIQTNESNPSHIYAEDHIGDPDCATRDASQLTLLLGNCGMTIKKTKNPSSVIYKICITVQLHPVFITDNDRSYCAQCVYLGTDIIEDFQQSLSVSESASSDLEPKFDLVTPRCSYQIRRNSIDGPLIRYALVGETVYHVWKCYGENFQILVQNCYVEDGEGNHILIISGDGCGVDQYILQTPVYSLDRRTASQVMHVFKFAGKAITRFTCEIRICVPSSDNCHLSAPYVRCPRREENDRESNNSSGAFIPMIPVNGTSTADAAQEKSTEITIGKGSWNVTTRKLNLITPPQHLLSTTTITESSDIEEPFFISAADNYGFYSESSDAMPPSVQPLPRNSEKEIQVEPSIYERRAKRNSFTNRLTKKDAFLDSSKKNHYSSYDVSGVITVLESPDQVAYFEKKYPSTGTRHDTTILGITDTVRRSLVKCMPQLIFLALIGVIVLSIILISVTISCITHHRSCNHIIISRTKNGELWHQIQNRSVSF
ncbi:unnamed protein product [Brugia pahangi]|uniref:ZP domain-containing protein n=1 Tax=Brugia pahangi TaxID=6280 RepID=A0A0N4TIA4_BRUPA|nr:unnamed protein product [Brugia pahangi]